MRLVWEITGQCNLKCMHCFRRKDRASLLGTTECLNIIDQFPELLVQKVMYTGGEPMLRADICDLIRASVERGADVDLVTNGLLVNRDRARALRQSGLTEATVSLDGPREVHDMIRCQVGAFDLACGAIRALVDEGVPVDVVCVVNRANVTELSRLIEIAISLGCASVTFSGLAETTTTRDIFEQMALDPEEISELETEVIRLREIAGESMPIRTVALLERPHPGMNCPANRIVAIDSFGKVKHCLLSSSGSKADADIRLGLSRATEDMDWSAHCGAYRWAIRASPAHRSPRGSVGERK